MEPILIDLNDYVHAGEGANGESFNHREHQDTMLKLYFESARPENVANELEYARKVWETGIPTPEPGDLVTDGKGRYGIRFQRIRDKVSFAREVGDHPECTERLAREFAGMCRKLHGTEVDRSAFPDIKQCNLRLIDADPFLDERERTVMKRFVLDAPDSPTALHGDLHFGNALIAGDKRYFIDLGDFAYGHPYFDLGMLALCCNHNGEGFTREAFHMDCATARGFWKHFVKGYFGEDMDPQEADRMLLPYAGLKSVLVEVNSRGRHPVCHEAFKDFNPPV